MNAVEQLPRAEFNRMIPSRGDASRNERGRGTSGKNSVVADALEIVFPTRLNSTSASLLYYRRNRVAASDVRPRFSDLSKDATRDARCSNVVCDGFSFGSSKWVLVLVFVIDGIYLCAWVIVAIILPVKGNIRWNRVWNVTRGIID